MTNSRRPTLALTLCFAAGCVTGAVITSARNSAGGDQVPEVTSAPSPREDSLERAQSEPRRSSPRAPDSGSEDLPGSAEPPATARLAQAEAEIDRLRSELETLRGATELRKLRARQERRYRLAMNGWGSIPGDLPAPEPELHFLFAKLYSVLERERDGDEMAVLYRSATQGYEAFEALHERSRRQITDENGEVRLVRDPSAAGITGDDFARARETLYETVMPLLGERERREARRRIVGNE